VNTILTINNLTKKFGNLTAVDDLSFTIEKGNVYGILGPNGSGKSTTLGIVLNVVNKTTGDFHWFNGSGTTHEALKKVGAIIERPNFYPYMTAIQNLELVCKIKGVSTDKVEEKLELVELAERKNSKFGTFSLGMKQRLAIASALLNDPEILILDEPTNGLDPQGIHQNCLGRNNYFIGFPFIGRSRESLFTCCNSSERKEFIYRQRRWHECKSWFFYCEK
jgi:ABC-2 type transport system ATP-binding protein